MAKSHDGILPRVKVLRRRWKALRAAEEALPAPERDLLEALKANDKREECLLRGAALVPPIVPDTSALKHRRGRPSGKLDKLPVVVKVTRALQRHPVDEQEPQFNSRLALEVGKEYVRHLNNLAVKLVGGDVKSAAMILLSGHRVTSGLLKDRVLNFIAAAPDLAALLGQAAKDNPADTKSRPRQIVLQVLNLQGGESFTDDYLARLLRD